MFGMSLGKLLLLLIIIGVVWSAFKYAQRIETVRRAVRREMDAHRARQARGPTIVAEDLAKCDRCGAYVVPRSTSACGRSDCPWRR